MSDEKLNVINKIQIINAKKDLKTILRILNETDITILKYIKSIKVHDQEYIPESISGIKTSLGTATVSHRNDIIIRANIDIVSSELLTQNCSFEKNLKHEIGHICGYTKSFKFGGCERFANNYAENPDKMLRFKETIICKIIQYIANI